MSAAQVALSQCYALLKMDTSPARFEWMQGQCEAVYRLEERRRAWLARAGVGGGFADTGWHQLPARVREALNAAS